MIAASTKFNLPSQDGQHILHIKAVDIAGNVRQEHYTFIIDNTAPIAEFYGISDNISFSGTETIRVSPNDEYGIDYVSYSVNSELLSTQYSNFIYQFDTTQFPDGSYDFTIKIVDLAGNFLMRSYKVKIVNEITLWEQDWFWVALSFGLSRIAIIIGWIIKARRKK